MRHRSHPIPPHLSVSSLQSRNTEKLCLLNVVHLNNLEVQLDIFMYFKIEDSRNFNSNEIVTFHTSPEKALKCQEVASFVAPVYVTKSPHQPDMECTETVTGRWSSLHLKKIQLLRSMDLSGESGNVWWVWFWYEFVNWKKSQHWKRSIHDQRFVASFLSTKTYRMIRNLSKTICLMTPYHPTRIHLLNLLFPE